MQTRRNFMDRKGLSYTPGHVWSYFWHDKERKGRQGNALYASSIEWPFSQVTNTDVCYTQHVPSFSFFVYETSSTVSCDVRLGDESTVRYLAS